MTAHERQIWYWTRECDEARKMMNSYQDGDERKEQWRKKYGTALKCLKEVMGMGGTA